MFTAQHTRHCAAPSLEHFTLAHPSVASLPYTDRQTSSTPTHQPNTNHHKHYQALPPPHPPELLLTALLLKLPVVV